MPTPSHASINLVSSDLQAVPPPSDPSPSQPPSRIWGHPTLSPKIREACRVAREKGYQYMWIDSCCIDKTSSSELSESINSMYQSYALADVCYTFLAGVPAKEDHRSKRSLFRRSRWFTRGWTLQELIAPMDVVFFAEDWTVIGSKHSLADLVTEVANINYNALLRIEPLDEFSVAQRLSWAAERETTRVEDRAYSLLGIFDINMPTLYGEGGRAFRRLQEEIMQRTPDQSLFAWTDYGLPDPNSQLYDPDATYADTGSRRFHFETMPKLHHPSLLAPSLEAFIGCAVIESLPHDEVVRRLRFRPDDSPATDYDFTPYGIRMELPMISFLSSDFFSSLGIGCVDEQRMELVPSSQWYLVILGCEHRNFPGQLLGRVCYIRSPGSSIEHLYSGYIEEKSTLWSFTFTSDLLPLSQTTIARLKSPSHISLKTLYVPQPTRDEGVDNAAYRKPHETIKLVLLKKTRNALSAQGYAVTLRSPDNDIHPTTHSITLLHSTHTIAIDYHHTLKGNSYDYQRLTITAHVKTSGPVPQHAPGEEVTAVPQTPVDGLGTQVSCTNSPPWDQKLRFEPDAELNLLGDTLLTVRHGLTFATINHYILDIELKSRQMVVSELDGNLCRALLSAGKVATSTSE